MSTTLDKTTKIKWLVTIFVTIVVYLLPTNDVYTKQMSLFFTVTIFCLFLMACEFFSPIVVSVIMPMAWVAVGATTITNAMSGWTNSIIFMCAGAYFLANALDECGLLRRIALLILTKFGKNWTSLLFGIFFTGVVISIITFGLSYIIVPLLCVGVLKSMGVPLKSKASAMVCLAAMLGCCSSRTFTYSPATYSLITAQGQLLDPTFNIAPIDVFIQNWPMFFVSCLILWIIKKIWGSEVTIQSVEYFKTELTSMGRMTVSEKKAVIFLAIFFVLMLTSPVTGIDVNLLFAIAPWLLLFPGINVASDNCISNLNWQNLFFIAACMGIGSVASTLGIGTIVADIARPYMTSAGTAGFFGGVFLITFILNFFMTPIAIWALITAPLCDIALSINLAIKPCIYALVMCSEAIILPYEYVPYLIVYSFGMISMNDFIKISILRCILFMLGFAVVMIPFWTIIGIM